MVIRALAMIIVALATASGGSAAPTSYSLATTELVTLGTVVQQPGVVNPYDCLWHVDDRWTASGVGRKIEAGVVASASVCLIADDRIPFWGARVRAEAGTLEVMLHFEPQGVTWRLEPEQFGRRDWEWKGCLYGPFYIAGTHTLPEIPDTNGGRGVIGSVTFTVTNTADRFVANPSAIVIERPGPRFEYCKGEPVGVGAGGASWRTAGFE